MKHLTRAQARRSLSDFRSANMAQAGDESARRDWVRDHEAIAGW